MKRIVLALGFVIVFPAIFLFAGGASEKGAVATTPIELQFWYLQPHADQVAAAVAMFEAANPGVSIKMTGYGDPAILDALNVAAASKTGPDLYFNWSGYLQWPLVDAGFTLDLTPYMNKYNWDKKILKSALDVCTYNGKLYAVPWELNAMMLWGRKDLLDKYNAGKIPATMDEFKALGNKLAKDKIALISTAGVDGWLLQRVMTMILENYVGVDYHNKLHSLEASWLDPKVIAAFLEFRLWVNNGYFNDGFLGIKPDDSKVPWYKGAALSVLEGAWTEANLKNDAFDFPYVIFPFPVNSRPQRAIMFPSVTSVTKISKYPDIAVKFADFRASLDTETALAAKGFPAGMSATVGFKFASPAQQGMAALMGKTGSVLVEDEAFPFEIANAQFAIDAGLSDGSMTPQQAAQYMQKAVDSYKTAHKK